MELQKVVFGVTEGCFGSYRRLFLELQKAVFLNESCGLFFVPNFSPPRGDSFQGVSTLQRSSDSNESFCLTIQTFKTSDFLFF